MSSLGMHDTEELAAICTISTAGGVTADASS